MFIVYKVTNQLNQKYYIGVHKTNNPSDSYMGSGRAIRIALKKYGRENFTKEILYITENKDEAYQKEKDLTIEYFKPDNYNMRRGGVGGFTKENSSKGRLIMSLSGSHIKGGQRARDLKVGVHGYSYDQLAANGRKGGLKNKGVPKTEEHKQKLRDTWAKKLALMNPL